MGFGCCSSAPRRSPIVLAFDMATVSQRTLNWLHSILIRDHYDSRQTYQDPNRTYYDVANVLAQYPSLTPRTEVYTFENGFSALVLQLTGTLPVSFRGTVYKFPVTLWVPNTYPREPPMVYVIPTQDMAVRVGQHVTLEGRVYHHYLAHWAEAWERSSLLDLLLILRDVFAKEPPVRYKQQGGQPQQAQEQMQAPPPLPPLPPELASTPIQSPTPPSSIRSHQPTPRAPPPPPPKPGQAPSDSQFQQPQAQGSTAQQYSSPPPVPPLPPKEYSYRQPGLPPQHAGLNSPGERTPQSLSQQGPPLPRNQYNNIHQPASAYPQGPGYFRPPSGAYDSPRTQDSLRGSLQAQPPSHQYRAPPAPPHPAHPQAAPAPPSLPPNQQPHLTRAHQPTPQATPSTQPPAPTHRKPEMQDLLTSPFELELPSFTPSGPAPPIPPNPEKDALLHAISRTLTEALSTNITQSESAAQSLLSQSQSLHAAITTLQSEISSLTSLNSTLESNRTVLQQSLHRADGAIAHAQSRVSSATPSSSSDPAAASGLPPIDEVLVAPTVVGKQLYDLVAEERGIQQAIYALQVALVKGVIGVETWSRHTRGLAREAFLKQALIRKIGKGMGLEEHI